MLQKHNLLVVLFLAYTSGIDFTPNVGKPIEAKDVPWMVSLQMSEGDFAYCGAALIKATDNEEGGTCTGWIVTSASCLKGAGEAELKDIMIVTVRNASLDVSTYENATKCKVESTIAHKDYNSMTNVYDIGLIKVNFPVSSIEPSVPNCASFPVLSFAMPPINETHYPDMNATMYGWGLTVENGPLQKSLQSTNMTLRAKKDCASAYGDDVFFPATMICAGGVADEGGPCSYDTGGPLICHYKAEDQDNIHTYLCGVASFGRGCGASRVPAVFTDITDSNITEWIKENIN